MNENPRKRRILRTLHRLYSVVGNVPKIYRIVAKLF